MKYCALTTISASLRSFILPAAEFLSKNGYDVTVGCQADDKLASELAEEIKFIPLKITRGYSIAATVLTIAQLYRYFRKERIQMLEYGTENVSFCASIAGWAARVPVRIYNHWGARYIGFTGLSRKFSIFIERTIAKFSTHVRQQTDKNMAMCIADKIYPASKVKVLGYGGTVGADFTRFDIAKKDEYNTQFRLKYNIPMSDIVFGDVGYIRRDKGHNELLSAFKRLANDNAWLVLVGDVFEPDSPDDELMKWAMESERVIFTGRVIDVEHYVAAFDCMVHPSYREGLGMVLQEAGAMGVPYIACDIPGPGEIGIDGVTGLLVEKGNADDLFEKMNRFLNDKGLIYQMSSQMYELTKARYERTVMLQRILEDRDSLKEALR